MGVRRTGARKWVAKIRYQRHSLESPQEVNRRTAQIVLEDARLNFPDLFQDFLHALSGQAAQRKDPDEDDIDFLLRTNPVIDGRRLNDMFFLPIWVFPTANPEDVVFVKAKYRSYALKFVLYRPWEKAKLEEQVKKRLPKLEPGTYLIKSKDEDGEITCDEDLQLYIETSRLQGTTTSIVVLLEGKVADEFCVDQL